MFWYDGSVQEEETLTLSIRDPALLYGATVFTTLRIYQQSLNHPLTQWSAHCQRLCDTLKCFNWQYPQWERVTQGAALLALNYTVLRVVIFPDGREWITGRQIPDDLVEMQKQGVKGWVATSPIYSRSLAYYKTGNYLGSWLALQQAQSQGQREAILINSEGHWLETATGNLWGWKEGLWFTPPLTMGILPGLARSRLKDYLSSVHRSPLEVIWTLDLIQSLEIIAYSNSVVEIVPFQSIEIDQQVHTFSTQHPALDLLRDYYTY